MLGNIRFISCKLNTRGDITNTFFFFNSSRDLRLKHMWFFTYQKQYGVFCNRNKKERSSIISFKRYLLGNNSRSSPTIIIFAQITKSTRSYSYLPILFHKANQGFIKQPSRTTRPFISNVIESFHPEKVRPRLAQKDEVNRQLVVEETSPQARPTHIFSSEKKSTADTENRFRRFTKADSPWSVCRTVSFHTSDNSIFFYPYFLPRHAFPCKLRVFPRGENVKIL